MKKILFTLVVLLASVSLSVAANKADGEQEAPLAINGVFDNVFAGAGLGVNTIFDNGYLGKTGLGADAYIGKWLVPYGAVRVGWHGLNNQAVDTSNGWFAGADRFSYNYLHIDWIWDILNTFKYSQTRLVNPRLGVQAGAILTGHNGITNTEFGMGPTAQVAVRLGTRLEASVEATMIVAREEAYRNAGRFITFPSVSAGIAVNIGKTGFDRAKGKDNTVFITKTVEVENDCGHDKIINTLLAEIDSLKAAVPEAKVDYVNRPAIIYFDLDKDFLTRREQAHLEFVMNHLPEGAKLIITGHADKETGNASHNMDLSRRRSETVKKTLVAWGFPAASIETAYHGDTDNTQYSWDKPEKNRCCYIQVVLDK